MVDRRLAFGARKSPSIFNRLTQSIRRMMERRGYHTVAYIDDFFLAAETFEQCSRAYSELIKVLRTLGFRINWSKVTDPTQDLVFLGVNLDTRLGTMTLDQTKRAEICCLLDNTLQRKRLSRAQLESLIGKLCWAANVIPWGRTQLCPLYRALKSLKENNHKILVYRIKQELLWWSACLTECVNPRYIWPSLPVTQLATDSSQHACGAFYERDWLYCDWRLDLPEYRDEHINIKELGAVLLAVNRWHSAFRGRHVIVRVDNMPALYMINKGSSSNTTALDLLKRLAICALVNNFTIEAVYIPGIDNTIPDAISRLHQPGQIQRFTSLLHLQHASVAPPGYWLSLIHI